MSWRWVGLLASIVLGLAFPRSAASSQESSSTVVSEKGNIILIRASGERVQLTSLGLDADPAVSPDGRWIVFVRRTPGYLIDTGKPSYPDSNEIWLVRADDRSRPRRLLRGRPGSFDARQPDTLVQGNFFEPQFSPDGKRVYVGASTWATSNAFWVVDIKTGTTRFLLSAVTFEVVRRGPLAGNLIVTKRLLDRDSPRYPYYLLNPDGKDLRQIGESEADLRVFKANNGIRP
jgi:Tol biopolymer transport system component